MKYDQRLGMFSVGEALDIIPSDVEFAAAVQQFEPYEQLYYRAFRCHRELVRKLNIPVLYSTRLFTSLMPIRFRRMVRVVPAVSMFWLKCPAPFLWQLRHPRCRRAFGTCSSLTEIGSDRLMRWSRVRHDRGFVEKFKNRVGDSLLTLSMISNITHMIVDI